MAASLPKRPMMKAICTRCQGQPKRQAACMQSQKVTKPEGDRSVGSGLLQLHVHGLTFLYMAMGEKRETILWGQCDFHSPCVSSMGRIHIAILPRGTESSPGHMCSPQSFGYEILF